LKAEGGISLANAAIAMGKKTTFRLMNQWSQKRSHSVPVSWSVKAQVKICQAQSAGRSE